MKFFTNIKVQSRGTYWHRRQVVDLVTQLVGDETMINSGSGNMLQGEYIEFIGGSGFLLCRKKHKKLVALSLNNHGSFRIPCFVLSY